MNAESCGKGSLNLSIKPRSFNIPSKILGISVSFTSFGDFIYSYLPQKLAEEERLKEEILTFGSHKKDSISG